MRHCDYNKIYFFNVSKHTKSGAQVLTKRGEGKSPIEMLVVLTFITNKNFEVSKSLSHQIRKQSHEVAPVKIKVMPSSPINITKKEFKLFSIWGDNTYTIFRDKRRLTRQGGARLESYPSKPLFLPPHYIVSMLCVGCGCGRGN